MNTNYEPSITLQNEIEMLARKHGLTLSVWRTNKPNRCVVSIALHTGERAEQFRYQKDVVWSTQTTVELSGRQFVPADVSIHAGESLREARAYLNSLTPVVTEVPTEIVTAVTTDESTDKVTEILYESAGTGWGDGEPSPASAWESLFEELNANNDDDQFEYEIDVRDEDIRVYATRREIDDDARVEYRTIPSHDNWRDDGAGGYWLVIARAVDAV